MSFIASLYNRFIPIERRQGDYISLKQHHEAMLSITSELHAKLSEIEHKKELLRAYWNTIIEASKSKEVNFGSIEEALNYITLTVANTLSVTRVSVWKYHADVSERIECVAAFNKENNQHFKQGALFFSDNHRYFTAIKTERVIAVDNALEHEDTSAFAFKYLQPLQIKSLMDTPFFQDGKLAGVLCCENQFDYRNWSAEDIIFATSMAEVASLAFRSVAQRLHEKDLESFSYSVAHDLRAPLRTVLAYANILEEDYGKAIETEGNRLLHSIMDSASRMQNLIDSLLDFSRLNKCRLQTTMLDMNELVNSVVDQHRATPDSQPVDFRIGNLLNLDGDGILMRQVLSNLISNAVKYSSKRKNPIVEISSFKIGNEVVYTIKDNGVGFDAGYTDKLFHVFQRLHSSSEFEGNGIGLAIVHRVISRHNGRVWAGSNVNEGATFYFSLPCR